MPKTKQTPGTVLTALLKKYELNYNRLAKAVGLSSAMIRLIARDENPISAPVAFRLAKFFKTKPEYWLSLQSDFDISKAVENKNFAKELKDISTVDKVTFERKPKGAASLGAKPPAAKGKKAAAKDSAPKSAKAPAAKRGRPAAKPEKGAAVKAMKTTPGAKRGRPAAAVKTVQSVSESPAPQPKAPAAEAPVNEPQI